MKGKRSRPLEKNLPPDVHASRGWFFFGFIIHMFVEQLNKITIPVLSFPLGFYMAAQGSLIVFVVMLFLFAKQQDRIDREFGFAEED